MNETIENVVETTTDSFLEGFETDATFDRVETDTLVDETSKGQQEETKAEETEESKNNTENVTVEENVVVDKGNEVSQAEESPTSWNIKVLGEQKTVNAKDINVEMLQKAYDYDRIRSKYDESKPVMEMMKSFAEKANMSINDYVAYIRTEAKKSQGMTEEEAKRTIDLEDREAVIATKEAAQREVESQQAAEKQKQDDLDAKTTASLEEFAKAFPNEYKKAKDDPNFIPQEVWDAINKEGLSLTAAYSRWYVNNTNIKMQAIEKNSINSARSTGSMKSSGNDLNARDAFLSEW